MILTLTQPIGGFTPTAKISDDKCAWREVYTATDAEGKAATLIAYDTATMPQEMNVNGIAEFNLHEQLQSNVFHKVIARGEDADMHVQWMAIEADDTVTLDKWIEEHGAMDANQAATIVKSLLEGVKEVNQLTPDGGIYNLCPENISLAIDSSEGQPTIKGAYINNLHCAGRQYDGATPFSIDMLNILYTAPEARFGRFCPSSDIYVLGLILATMVSGNYPWNVAGVTTLTQLAVRRLKRRNCGHCDGLGNVFSRTITNNISLRYKTVDDMITALRVFLGEIEETKEDKERANRIKRQWASNESAERESKDEEDDRQPKCRVVFTELSGNGFKEVAGMDDIKKKLQRNYIDIVRHKDIAQEFNIIPPALTLLAGPSGCGKTFLVRKLAEECGLPFSYITPAQLGNTFAHGSQRMIADLFAKAAKKAKDSQRGVMIMLDEFDAIAPARTSNDSSCHNDEVNELLTQLNECSARGIYVIAATNRPDMLDSAVTRSGRMDDFIYIGLPDKQARKEIFELELGKCPHDECLDLNRLTDITDGFTCSDISAIVKEAGRAAFDLSIHTENRSIVKINQQMMEETIHNSRPSVSKDELREYEHARDRFIRKSQGDRRPVGFNVYAQRENV